MDRTVIFYYYFTLFFLSNCFMTTNNKKVNVKSKGKREREEKESCLLDISIHGGHLNTLIHSSTM